MKKETIVNLLDFILKERTLNGELHYGAVNVNIAATTYNVYKIDFNDGSLVVYIDYIGKEVEISVCSDDDLVSGVKDFFSDKGYVEHTS